MEARKAQAEAEERARRAREEEERRRREREDNMRRIVEAEMKKLAEEEELAKEKKREEERLRCGAIRRFFKLVTSKKTLPRLCEYGVKKLRFPPAVGKQNAT